MQNKRKMPLDRAQAALQALLGGLTWVIYAAFALLVLIVAFGFLYAALLG